MTSVAESIGTVNFDDAVHEVARRAHDKLPVALHARIESAVALVLSGGVWMEEDGATAQVRSSNGQTWYSVNGSCLCEDAAYRAPEGYCKHVLAKMLFRRARDLMRQSPPAAVESAGPAEPDETPHGIPPQFVVQIQGHVFVKYAGLLAMAHEHGLVSLKARFISVTPELALAEAEAVFADGKVFVEAADSSPQNTPAHVRPHFPRLALTRCKARCLRDALNISLVALEELGQDAAAG